MILVIHGTYSSEGSKVGIISYVFHRRGGITSGTIYRVTKVQVHIVDIGRIVPSIKLRFNPSLN